MQPSAPNSVPAQVVRRRRSVYDVLKRVGTPFLFKHRWTDNDVTIGLAQPSPAFNDIYGTSVTYDSLSHGTGFVSQVLSPDEWYDPNGNIVVSPTQPGSEYTQAPLYRGSGPGWIVWCIQTDAPDDYLKLEEGGTVVRVQEPQIICPWFPTMNDGDLLISLLLDNEGNILDTYDRWELKQTRQITIRGYNFNGARETAIDTQIPYGSAGTPLGGTRGVPYTESYTNMGNAFIIQQLTVQNRLPNENVAYQVEVDR